ncbi:MAG: hypothetical protein Kow0026_09960 [Oricola sp.]
MTRKLSLALAFLVAGSGIALADHNSRWGEGTALDPAGIHDARIDSLDAAGDEPFGETVDAGGGRPYDFASFMRQGRPDTIDIDRGGSAGASGSGNGGGNGGGGNGGGNGRN